MQRFINIGVSLVLCVIAIGIGLVVARTFGSGGPAPTVYVTPGPTQPNQNLAQVGTPTAQPSARLVASSPTPAASPKLSVTPAEPTKAPPTPSRAPATPAVSPRPTTALTNAAYIEYTVQKGDILYSIALEYDVTIEEILAINEIDNPASLTVGEVIRIPRK